MKNATEFDVECLNKNWYSFLTDKMFLVKHPWYGDVLAHLKDYINVGSKNMFVMETSDGCPILSEYGWIKAVPKKEGTPAKPKRKHVKGSKPYLSNQGSHQVAYDPSLIKVGTKVLCRDKKIRTIEHIGSDYISFVECHNLVDMKSGLGNYICKKPFYCDIMKIIVAAPQQANIEYDKYNGLEQGFQDKVVLNFNVTVNISRG